MWISLLKEDMSISVVLIKQTSKKFLKYGLIMIPVCNTFRVLGIQYMKGVATCIVAPKHIVAGDRLCQYSRHILSP